MPILLRPGLPTITPCFDGQPLVGLQREDVEKGLAVLSTKHTHRNCTCCIDAITDLPTMSCARKFLARTSFWDVHRPDVSKLKALEGENLETSAQLLTQLLRAHNTMATAEPDCVKGLKQEGNSKAATLSSGHTESVEAEGESGNDSDEDWDTASVGSEILQVTDPW